MYKYNTAMILSKTCITFVDDSYQKQTNAISY